MEFNIEGLHKWMEIHPRKSLYGLFVEDGKPLTNSQARQAIIWAYENGCETEEDIPKDVIENIIKNNN